MAVIGLDHVQLAIPEGGEARARQFFGVLLEMREVAKPKTLSPKGCWFESGSVNLHVGIDPEFIPARKAHLALLVDDLDAIEAKLVAAGHPIMTDKPVPGYRRFFSEDPFGNRIEFMQRDHA